MMDDQDLRTALEPTEAQIHAAMDSFYPGEDWRTDLGCALETSLRDMRAALIAALTSAQAPDKAAEREGLKARMVAALDGKTKYSRDCHLSGEYLCSLVWPMVEDALAPKLTGTEAAEIVRAYKAGAVWAHANPIHADMPLQRQLAANRYAATPTPPVSPSPDSTGPAGEVCPYDVGPGCPCRPCACRLGREGKKPAPHPDAPPPRAATSLPPDSTGPARTDLPQSVYEALTFVYRGMDKIEEVAAFAREHVAYIIHSTAALTPSAPIAAPVRDEGWSVHSPAEIIRRTRCEADAYGNEFVRAAIWRDCCDAILSKLPTPASDVPGDAQTQEGGRAVAIVMEALWRDSEDEVARLKAGFWPSDLAIAEAFHEHRRETQPSLPPWSEVQEGSGIWQISHNFATRLSSLRPAPMRSDA